MYAKAAGSSDIWFFEDEGWATRTAPGDWGEPTPLPRSVPLPPSLRNRPIDDGYVRLELSHLKPRVYNVEDLRWELSNVYRALIERGEIRIIINGTEVEPLQLPRSTAFHDIPVDLKTVSRHRLRGWVGRLDRDALLGASARRRIQGGIRCLYQGRLVREGEYFGFAGDAKGSLASLIGEIELRFVSPNLMKTDFDRGSKEWAEVEAVMHPFLAPIIADFRKANEKRAYTREERKTLTTVCGEIGEVFRRMRQERSWPGSEHIDDEVAERGGVRVDTPILGHGGRLAPRQTSARTSDEGLADNHELPEVRGRRNPNRNHSIAPHKDQAVGGLLRLLDRVSGGSMLPPAVLGSFDPSLRSAWQTEAGQTKLVVNTEFPLYSVFGATPGYLAETVIMELAKPTEGEDRTLADYAAEVTNLTAAWARLHLAAE